MKKATKESRQIAYYINDWLNCYVPTQKSSSEHTLKSYSVTLSLYIGFLETEKGIDSSNLSYECFNRDNIEEWQNWLIDKRLCSPETCNNRLASIRAFLKYLGHKEVSLLYLWSEASQIERKLTIKKKVNGLSREAIEALLSAPNQSTRTGRRDLTLMILMYNCALRIDELLSLKVNQLHLNSNKPNITVIGKGLKARTLYLLPRTVAHLKKYLLEYHGENLSDESYVFYSRITGTYGKMSQTAVNNRLKKHAVSAHSNCDEVPEDLHAHQIRHAKASHWLEEGMNIIQISFLLGHEQLQTTMVYLDITTEQENRALATLESENDDTVSKKWKVNSTSLANFCSVKELKT